MDQWINESRAEAVQEGISITARDKTDLFAPLDGGEVQTMPLEERFDPAVCDAYGAYEF